MLVKVQFTRVHDLPVILQMIDAFTQQHNTPLVFADQCLMEQCPLEADSLIAHQLLEERQTIESHLFKEVNISCVLPLPQSPPCFYNH